MPVTERDEGELLLYGANGYTGELMAREAVVRGLRPRLAGRRRDAIEPLARELDLPWRDFPLDDPEELGRGLEGAALVLSAAGPFAVTATPLRDACLARGLHYLDITGEIPVLEASLACDEAARRAGSVVLSGVGFDVVPSDCLAAHLAARLPGATRLTLAFTSDGGASKGTSRTGLRMLPSGGRVRRGGELVEVPIADRSRQVPFDHGTLHAVRVPWGDVATAFHSTGIPDIEVYMAMDRGAARFLRATRWLHGLLRWRWLRAPLEGWIDHSVTGPDAARRRTGRAHLWGEVERPDGARASATLAGPEGYRLTALASVEIARRVLAGEVEPGAWTPSGALGADFVRELPDTERADL